MLDIIFLVACLALLALAAALRVAWLERSALAAGALLALRGRARQQTAAKRP